jgi:hypothetical protein
MDFDLDGNFSKLGKLDSLLYQQLKGLEYFEKNLEGPKSLGKEWVDQYF